MTEEALHNCFAKQMFLKISQNPETHVPPEGLQLYEKETEPCNFPKKRLRNFQEHLFTENLQTTASEMEESLLLQLMAYTLF